ncbi:MAG: LamG domain-containing protein, partial [Planctomycetota bacterium]
MFKEACLLICLVLVFGFFNVHSAHGQWGPPEDGDVWWCDQSEDPNNHLWNGPNNWAYWDEGIGDVVLGNEPNLSNMVFIGKGVLEKPWPETLFEYTIDPTPVIDSNVAAKCYALWGPSGEELIGWYYYLNILGGSLTIGNMNAPEYSTRWEIAGTDGSGDVNMVDGVVNVAGDMTVGNWGGLADVNMTGGEINVKFALCIPGVDSGDGENKEAEGTLKLKGGTIRCGGLYLNEWATFPDDYDWTSEWMSTSTREPITGSPYESTIDLSGGTLIIDGSYGDHIARFVTNGYITVYGVEEGDIAPDDRRAYVNVDYDTVEDATTVTAATADPEQAYNPRPAHYSEDQPINVNLRWSAGDGATSHHVYLGTSFEDVNEADTSDESGIYRGTRSLTTYDPPEFLKIQTTYYWRIDEFDGATMWKGRVWCFTVANYRVVDDFDSYSNDNALYNVWKDYWTNGTGAEIYLQRDQDFEPDGHEMEYNYNNVDEGLGSVAEASIDDLGIDKDWTTGGITKSLVLYFYGDPANSTTENDQMYVAVEDADDSVGVVPYDGDANDVKKQEWHEWNVDLQEFIDQGVDLTDVAKLYIGFGGPLGGQTAAGGDGTVYFNDIKLYPSRCLPEKVQTDFTGDCIVGMEDLDLMAGDWLLSDSSVTVVPPAFAPQLWYRFDEGTGTIIHNDGNLPGLDGNFPGLYPVWVTPGAPAVDSCDPNFAMYFDGSNDYVEIDYSPELSLNDFTVSAWVNLATEPSGDGAGVIGTRVGVDNTFDLKVQENKIHGDIGDGIEWINIYIDIRAGDTGSNGQGGDLDLGTWYMITYVIDNTNQEVRLYLDGDFKKRIAISGTPLLMKSDQKMWIGQTGYPGEVMDGLIDDVRIYKQALSQSEVLYLTGAEGT